MVVDVQLVVAGQQVQARHRGGRYRARLPVVLAEGGQQFTAARVPDLGAVLQLDDVVEADVAAGRMGDHDPVARTEGQPLRPQRVRLHGDPRVGTTGVPQFQPARIPAHRQQFHLRGVSRRPGILVQAAVGVDERLGELLVDARAGGQRQQQRQPCRVADRASPLPAAGPVFHCAPRIGCNAGLQDSAGAGSHAPPPHGAQPQAMRASSQAQAGNVARHSTMP